MIKVVHRQKDSRARTIASLESEPSATMEAESILKSLLSSLSNRNLSLDELPQLMRQYMHSLRLLGIDEKWASKELKGYPDGKKIPNYRGQICSVIYLGVKSGKVVAKAKELCEFDQGVNFMVNHREKGWVIKCNDSNQRLRGKLAAAERFEKSAKWDIDVVLGRIIDELFDRASKIMVKARFGSAIDTIFRDYQRTVGSAISKLEIEDHLGAAYRNLKGSDEASWRAAALACRNVLHDLPTKLWCVQCAHYNFDDGKGLIKLNNPRIKLKAFMREKGLNKKDIPVALLEPVYADASAAKTKCSYEGARSVLIMTYLYLAELIRQTDMKSVTELKKGSSKGKE